VRARALFAALKPAAPGLLYVGGLASVVVAGFLFTVIAGFIALGVSLLAVGYMAEVNQ
jgi:hypothetical protein